MQKTIFTNEVIILMTQITKGIKINWKQVHSKIFGDDIVIVSDTE